MGWAGYGTGWLWFGPFMLLFWGLVIAAVIWAARSSGRPGRTEDGALEILRRRLAAGEITPEEYERTRKLLQP